MPGRPATADASVARSELRRDLVALRSAFEEAVGKAGVVEREIEVAGFLIRLRAAGPALLDEFWPAIAHLEAGNEGLDGMARPAIPDLTISLWDSASTGVAGPTFGWTSALPQEARGPHSVHGDSLSMAYRPVERDLATFDRVRREAMLWTPDHAEVPVYVRASPFFIILTWWMREHGAHPVHSGAVGDEDGGVLLVGQGGSGKSTTAISSLLGGLSYASDDYVMLDFRPEPHAWSLYSTAKLEPGHSERFPALEPVLYRPSPEGEKYLAYLHAFAPERVARGFPLAAVIAPSVGAGREATFSRIRPAEALAALAPSTLLAMPAPRDPSTFAAMANVVRALPCFRLEIGSDLSSIAPAVRGVIEAS